MLLLASFFNWALPASNGLPQPLLLYKGYWECLCRLSIEWRLLLKLSYGGTWWGGYLRLLVNLLSGPLLIGMHLNLLLLRLLINSLRTAVSSCRCTIILLRFEYLHALAGQGPSVAKLPLWFSRSCGRAWMRTSSKMCAGDIDMIVVNGAQKLFIAHL